MSIFGTTKLTKKSNKEKQNTNFNLRPLGEKLIVKRDIAKDQTSSGILLPDNAQEKPRQGTVVAVGQGKILDNGEQLLLNVKVGEVVLFGVFSGTEINVNGEEYLILNENDILAIVE